MKTTLKRIFTYFGKQARPGRGEVMRLTTGYEKDAGNLWVLRLEVPMAEFLAAKFDDLERAIIAECGDSQRASEVLLAAQIIARRIEEHWEDV